MQKNKEKRSTKKVMFLLFAMIGMILGALLYVHYRRQDTLTIGIFYGSNWDVPGTEYYDILDAAIEKFETRYPGTKVTYVEGIPVDDYSEWLSEAILKGEEPDVYFVLSEDFYELASIGALKSLDMLMLKDEAFQEEDFYQAALDSGDWNGEQYALPFECNPRLMFVNKTLLKDAGLRLPEEDWDWDQFYRICESVTGDSDQDGKIDRFGSYGYGWLDAVVANGSSPFNEDGTQTNVNTAEFMEAVEFVKNLRGLYQDYQVTSEDFDLGKVAFMPLTFAEYRTYMPYPWRIKKYSDFEWNCLPMPAGSQGENISSMETLLVGISSRTPMEEKAWYFAGLLTMDEEIQSLIYEHGAGVSPLRRVTTDRSVMDSLNQDTPGDSDIDMTLLDSVMETARPSACFRNYDEIYDTLEGMLTAYIEESGASSVELYNIQNKIQDLLN